MNLPIQSLTESFAVAGQLPPQAMAAIAAAGFKSVICNRPDFEDGPSQPTSASVAEAAQAAGLAFAHLPVQSAVQTPDDARRMAELLQTLPQPVLAYCRSGARSARLYALAQTVDL